MQNLIPASLCRCQPFYGPSVLSTSKACTSISQALMIRGKLCLLPYSDWNTCGSLQYLYLSQLLFSPLNNAVLAGPTYRPTAAGGDGVSKERSGSGMGS